MRSTNLPSKRVIVGLSGGVDSSVSALLLKQRGYAVEALFMKNWEEDDNESYCSAAQDIADAQAVCDRLAIPLHTINFSAEYWDKVFANFLQEYRQGRTPNPDILCNKEIKFKAFLDYALQKGADYIAMGHYAQKTEDNGHYFLQKGQDSNKDQSYFLYTLNQAQLARSIFPIGDLTKNKVREIAQTAGLVTHGKKDSTGICFIGERRFKNFLAKYLPAQPGAIETVDGITLGQHEGLMYYTLGQRQGIGIGGRNDANSQPWYVLAKNLDRNVLIVGQGHDHPLLFSQELFCSQVHWISGKNPAMPLHCAAKTRYRQQEASCIVTQVDADRLIVKFSAPQRAVTPGQSVVFYQQATCLGGGIIDHSK